MFSQFFGNYLIKNNTITLDQFSEVIEHQKTTRVKLGLIAVSEKLLTSNQADEINLLQAKMDKRFGDIAVEKGYLTNEQITRLLDLQGNEYLLFIQTILDKNIMTMEDIDSKLIDFQKANNFTDFDLDAIKSSDIDRIIPVFFQINEPFYNDHIGLTLRNIIRFIDTQIRIEKAYHVSEYSFDHLACQSLKGKHNLFFGIASKGNGLLSIANPFANENFDELNEESFDSVCEFINCINGLFASKISQDDIDLDMLPPIHYSNQTIRTNNKFYVVPIHINRTEVELIISINSIIEVN